MLIEEKRYNSRPKYFQKKMFEKIDKSCRADPLYRGFYYLIFEKTSPEDGRIFLSKSIMDENKSGKWINAIQLIKFLRFESI